MANFNHTKRWLNTLLSVQKNSFRASTYAPIGCNEVIKRKDLQTHLRNKKDYHLEKSMDMVVQLSMGQSELSLSIMSMDDGEGKRDSSHLPLPFHCWLQNTPTCYPRPLWVFKMERFQKKEKNEQWFSDPVYSHFGGYKMCLCVYANGRNNTNGSRSSCLTAKWSSLSLFLAIHV